MATITESIYTEEFDNQDKPRMKDKWYLEASSTCPLIAYKFNINFTVYNVDAAMTNYFYYHKYQNKEQIFCWVNDGYFKPVEKSCVLLLHIYCYWCIKTTGFEVPTIDTGKMILSEISRRATFDTEKVGALDMDKDDSNNESDQDSEGNYKQKMPKKKI